MTDTTFPQHPDDDRDNERPESQPMGSEPIDVWIAEKLSVKLDGDEAIRLRQYLEYSVAAFINASRVQGPGVHWAYVTLQETLDSLPTLPSLDVNLGPLSLTADEATALAAGRGDEPPATEET